MEIPYCPLCGARSTWVRFEDEVHNTRPDLRNRFPEDCHFCKNEERIHWKQWEEGIDVTQVGGHSMNANIETPLPGINSIKGQRIA